MGQIFNRYFSFVDQVSQGGHDLQTAVLKCALTDTAPIQASDTVFNAPPPASANGYTAGGNTLTTTSAVTTNGTFVLILADTTFTAAGGPLGPFRYAIIYNSSAGNKLVGYYDYESEITLSDAEQFLVDFDQTNGVLQLVSI